MTIDPLVENAATLHEEVHDPGRRNFINIAAVSFAGVAAIAKGGDVWKKLSLAVETSMEPSEQIHVPDQNLFGLSLALGGGLRLLVKDPGGYSPVDQGTENVTFGVNAGRDITSGYYNTVFGANAGQYIGGVRTTTTYTASGIVGNVGNTLFGRYAGGSINGGLDNTFVGTNCGLNANTCMDSSGFGVKALERIEGGSECAAFGHGALQYIVGSGGYETGKGHRLTAFGDQAGRFLNGEEGNRFEKTGGKFSTYIGARTTSFSNTALDEFVIGNAAEGRGDHTMQIGGPTNQRTFVAGVRASGDRPNLRYDPATAELTVSPAQWTAYNPALKLTSGGPPAATVDAEYIIEGGDCEIEGVITLSSTGGGGGAISIQLPARPKRSGGCAVIVSPNTGQAMGQMTWFGGDATAYILAFNGYGFAGVNQYCFRARFRVQP